MHRKYLAVLGLAATLLVPASAAAADASVPVVGVQKAAYKKAGGSKVLGKAIDPATCGLPAGGCLQHFTNGTVYTQGKKYGYTTTTGIAGEIIATERSQVGYIEKYTGTGGKHKTWLNKWMKSGREWCSFLHSWGSWASGNGKVIPKAISWNGFVKATSKSTVLERGTKPRVGAIAMFDFEGHGKPTHSGLVTSVKGGRIRTLEGNTTGGGLLGPGKRGIVEVWRARSMVLYYLYLPTT